MSVAPVTVSASVETMKVGALLVDLVKVGKKLAADGHVSLLEIPEALQAIMRDLIPAISEMQAVQANVSEDPAAFSMAVHVFAVDVVKAIVAK